MQIYFFYDQRNLYKPIVLKMNLFNDPPTLNTYFIHFNISCRTILLNKYNISSSIYFRNINSSIYLRMMREIIISLVYSH